MKASRWIVLVFAALGLAAAGSYYALSPPPKTWHPPRAELRPDRDLGTQITVATVADGKLWLTNGEALVSFALADGTRTTHFKDGVAAMTKSAGRLWVLKSQAGTYRLLEWKDSRFAVGPSFVPAKDERVFAMTATAAGPVIVSTHMVRVATDTGLRSVVLASNPTGPMPGGIVTVGAPETGGTVYVGVNRGEWGGGLTRIDLATGAVDKIEDVKRFVFNGMVLDKVMDDITAVIADPLHKDCVIVAAGEIHFLVSGRVLRVCGTKASLVFTQIRKQTINGRTIEMQEAFFGLAPARDGFWATGTGCAYRFQGAKPPQQLDCPELEDWHGIQLTRALPGIVLVATEANRRFSLSGTTPLIASLEK